jgi:hypothetical protein
MSDFPDNCLVRGQEFLRLLIELSTVIAKSTTLRIIGTESLRMSDPQADVFFPSKTTGLKPPGKHQ